MLWERGGRAKGVVVAGINIKLHVSPALAHLRLGVTTMGLLVAACAIIQMMIFGFVHFTEVRWVEIKPEPTVSSVAVVGGATPGTPRQRRTVEAETLAPEKIPSRWAGTLEDFSAVAVTLGVISAISFAGLCLLGVTVAAGGGVPGVERTVTACSWSLIIAALVAPWRDVLHSMPYPGVFGSYQTMLDASDGGGAGVVLFLTYLGLPLMALVGSVVALLKFRSGVKAGILTTMVSEVDEILEREMANIRTRGVSSNVGRGSAPLTRTVGEPAAPLPSDLLAGLDRAKAFRAAEEARAERGPASRGGDGPGRPI